MNLEGFFDALKKAGLTWRCNAYALAFDALRLRADVAPVVNLPLQSVCPITAVCFFLTGEYFTTYDFEEAGNLLGLDKELMMQIVEAADHVTQSGAPLGEYPELITLRARLLETMGIDEGGTA